MLAADCWQSCRVLLVWCLSTALRGDNRNSQVFRPTHFWVDLTGRRQHLDPPLHVCRASGERMRGMPAPRRTLACLLLPP